jgi:hypothetical protein
MDYKRHFLAPPTVATRFASMIIHRQEKSLLMHPEVPICSALRIRAEFVQSARSMLRGALGRDHHTMARGLQRLVKVVC